MRISHEELMAVVVLGNIQINGCAGNIHAVDGVPVAEFLDANPELGAECEEDVNTILLFCGMDPNLYFLESVARHDDRDWELVLTVDGDRFSSEKDLGGFLIQLEECSPGMLYSRLALKFLTLLCRDILNKQKTGG